MNGLGAAKDVNYVYDDDGKQTRMYVTGASYDYTFSYDLMGRFEKILPTGGSTSFQYYYDAASNETQRYNFLNGGVTQIYTRDSLNRMSRRDVKKGATTLSYEVYAFDPMSRLSSVTREDKQNRFTYYLDGELNCATYGANPTPTPSPPPPPPTPTATPTPTPGQVAEPTFSPPGYNYYPQPQIAPWISTTTTGAKICWTSDGSTPTSNGSTCTNGTLINGSGGSAPCSPFYEGLLRAIAFKSGMLDSVVHSEYYWREGGQGPRGPDAPDSGPAHTVTFKPIAFKSGMTDSLVHEDYYEGDSGMNPNTTRTVTYNLDRAGNRTSIVDSGVTKTYVPNNLNQYTSAEGLSVSNGFEHEVSEYQDVAYTYRNDERLIRATSGSDGYDLAYDALGRCVKRTLNNVTTYYIYDGEKPVLEYNSGGAIVARNVYGKWIDEILMRTDTTVNGGQPFYYQQDRNFNVTHLTNASGTVIEKYKYDAFGAPTVYDEAGNVRPGGTAFNNRFLFTGREYAATYGGTYVPAFNFYEYRARAYNPTLGRFMSEDPKGFDAGDYNLFRYCHNDPLDLTDPMGLEGGVQPQPGDHPLPSPAVVLPAPLGSNIPLRITLDAKTIEYANARGVNILASDVKANPEASQLRTIDPSRPRSMKEFIIAGNIIEHGNTMDTTPLVDPISLASGAFAAKTALTVAARTAAATRAMWVGKDGLAAAQASGATLLRPSRAALNAMRAGDMSLMQAESAVWARGATGRVPVFFGNGTGRTFLNRELPELLKNMNSGKVTGIDISF